MARGLDHVHTYQLYKKRSGPHAKERMYRCAHPKCYHFAEYERIIGKASCCNACGDEFILDYQAARAVKPICLNCSNSKRGKANRAAAALMKQLIPDENESLDGDETGY